MCWDSHRTLSHIYVFNCCNQCEKRVIKKDNQADVKFHYPVVGQREHVIPKATQVILTDWTKLAIPELYLNTKETTPFPPDT